MTKKKQKTEKTEERQMAIDTNRDEEQEIKERMKNRNTTNTEARKEDTKTKVERHN